MRPLSLIRYVGGKGRLCNQICREIARANIEYKINTYLEPCAGSGAVLLNKTPHKQEIINDIDDSLTDLWAVVKDPVGYRELQQQLLEMKFTPDNFELARQKRISYNNGIIELDMLTSAVYSYIVFQQSRMSAQEFFDTTLTETSYRRNIGNISKVHYRIQDIEIRQGDVFNILEEHQNNSNLLAYIDPPYYETDMYKNNMGNNLQLELVERLLKSNNKIILSGYDNPIYELLLNNGFKKKLIKEITVSTAQPVLQLKRALEYIWVNF